MEFHAQLEIDAPPAAVLRAAQSPQATERRLGAVNVDSSHVTRSEDLSDDAAASPGDTPSGTITTVIAAPAELIPEKVRRFAPSGARITIVEHFSDRAIHTEVQVAKAPISASWDTILTPLASGERTAVEYRGEVNARIPFVGGQIERKAVASVERVIRRDGAILQEIATS